MTIPEWVGFIFWVVTVLTVIAVIAVGGALNYPTGSIFLTVYLSGGIVGYLVTRIFLCIPPIAGRYDSEPYRADNSDLVIPYLIVGLLGAMLIVPMSRKHPHFRSDVFAPLRRTIGLPPIAPAASPRENKTTGTFPAARVVK
jgi:hypothetical protein